VIYRESSLNDDQPCSLRRRFQSADGADVDRIAFGDCREGLAIGTAPDGFGALEWGELGLPPEPDAVCHGPLAAFASSLPDELPFELRDGSCGLAESVLFDQRHVVGWVNDNKLPSGSLNQATFAPDGAVQIPSASCCIKG